MARIKVKAAGGAVFEVTVVGRTATRHSVTLSDEFYKKMTQGRISREELVERSFEFLLERESNTSILRSFDLPVIGRYFPEYEQTINARIK